MRGGFLNPLKPGQDAALQAIRATIAEFGLPRGSLSPDAHLADDLALDGLDGIDMGNILGSALPAAVHATLLALFHRILLRGPAT